MTATAPLHRPLAPTPVPVPQVAAPVTAGRPPVSDRTLPNGLRVVVAAKATVPTVELRLRVPFGADPSWGSASRREMHAATAELVATRLLSGTVGCTRSDVEERLAAAGAQVRVTVDPQRLLVIARTLTAGLRQTLEVLTDCLAHPDSGEEDFDSDRARLVERVRVARAMPGNLARELLLRQCFGDDPIVHQTPTVERVGAVSALDVATLHRQQMVPAGSVLTIVGDVDPGAVDDLVARTMAAWDAPQPARTLVVGDPVFDSPIRDVHRPTARQCDVRLAGPSVARDDAGYAAACVANHVLGGYFLSRLVRVLREEKGYIYAGASALTQYETASLMTMEFATGPDTVHDAVQCALEQLDRFARHDPAGPTEVENAKAHLCGTIAISMSTQAGMVQMLGAACGAGLAPDWIFSHVDRLRAVTVEQVRAAARDWAAERITGVVLAPS